jgi:ferredoxin
MKARIDHDRCVGAGWCLIAAPQVFSVGDDGLTYAAGADGHSERLLRRAAEGCPQQAVILEDEAGNQIYPRRRVPEAPYSSRTEARAAPVR